MSPVDLYFLAYLTRCRGGWQTLDSEASGLLVPREGFNVTMARARPGAGPRPPSLRHLGP